MLIKGQHFQKEMIEIMDEFLQYYDECKPFSSLDERANFEPQLAERFGDKYSHIKLDNTLPIEGIALIVELFCLCEKQTKDAHQFRLMLQWTEECLKGTRNSRSLLNLAINNREY